MSLGLYRKGPRSNTSILQLQDHIMLNWIFSTAVCFTNFKLKGGNCIFLNDQSEHWLHRLQTKAYD